jgi:hypothetical protein
VGFDFTFTCSFSSLLPPLLLPPSSLPPPFFLLPPSSSLLPPSSFLPPPSSLLTPPGSSLSLLLEFYNESNNLIPLANLEEAIITAKPPGTRGGNKKPLWATMNHELADLVKVDLGRVAMPELELPTKAGRVYVEGEKREGRGREEGRGRKREGRGKEEEGRGREEGGKGKEGRRAGEGTDLI